MPKRSVIKGSGFAAVLVGAVITASAVVAAPVQSDAWDAVFAQTSPTDALYFLAKYIDGSNQPHTLEYWRDGQQRLRRNTDNQIDLLARRDGAGSQSGDTRFHLIDHRRHLITHIDQANLYRIGRYTNWHDLVSVLTKPAQSSSVSRDTRAPQTIAQHTCVWYQVAPQPFGTVQHICWSAELGIPLRIEQVAADGHQPMSILWQIERVSTAVMGDAAFSVQAAGYTEVDANGDIDPASD